MNITGHSNDYTLILDGRELAALAAFASTDGSRSTIYGIGLDATDGQARVYTTDGNRLCIASSACDLDIERTLLIASVPWLARQAGVRGHISIRICPTDIVGTITSSAGATTFTFLRGTPPPVDAVIPRPDRTSHVPGGVGINSVYLADVARLVAAQGGQRGDSVRLSFGDALAPILCSLDHIPADTTWQAVIMPIRI